MLTKITASILNTNTVDINNFVLNGVLVNNITIDEVNDDIKTLVTSRALKTNIKILEKAISDIDPNNILYQDNTVVSLPIANTVFSKSDWETSNWDVVYGQYATYISPENKIDAYNYIKMINNPFTKVGTYFVSVEISSLDSGQLSVYNEKNLLIEKTIVPGIFNFSFYVENPASATLTFSAENVKTNETITLKSISVFYVTTRIERYLEYKVPSITSGGNGYASIEYVNRAIDELENDIQEQLDNIPNLNDLSNVMNHIKDKDTNPHGITSAMIGAAPLIHTHTLESLNAAPLNHTHNPTDIGAANATHTHTPEQCNAAPLNHTHNPADIGAANIDHTHTANEIGAAEKNHTHEEYVTNEIVDNKINESIGSLNIETGVQYLFNNLTKLSNQFVTLPINSFGRMLFPIYDTYMSTTDEISLDRSTILEYNSNNPKFTNYDKNYTNLGVIETSSPVFLYQQILNEDFDETSYFYKSISPVYIFTNNLKQNIDETNNITALKFTENGILIKYKFFTNKKISGIKFVNIINDYPDVPKITKATFRIDDTYSSDINIEFVDNEDFIFKIEDGVINGKICTIHITNIDNEQTNLFIPIKIKILFENGDGICNFENDNSLYSYPTDLGFSKILSIPFISFNISMFNDLFKHFHSIWFSTFKNEMEQFNTYISPTPVECGYNRKGIPISELCSNSVFDNINTTFTDSDNKFKNGFYSNKNKLNSGFIKAILTDVFSKENELVETITEQQIYEYIHSKIIEQKNITIASSNSITITHTNLPNNISINGYYLLFDPMKYDPFDTITFSIILKRTTINYDGYETENPEIPQIDEYGNTIIDGVIDPDTKILTYSFNYINKTISILSKDTFKFIDESISDTTNIVTDVKEIKYTLTTNKEFVSFLDVGVNLTNDFYNIKDNTIESDKNTSNKISKVYLGGYTQNAGVFPSGNNNSMDYYFDNINTTTIDDNSDYIRKIINNPYFTEYLHITPIFDNIIVNMTQKVINNNNYSILESSPLLIIGNITSATIEVYVKQNVCGIHIAREW